MATPNPEPTLLDVTNTLRDLANKVDKLAADVDRNLSDNDRFKADLDKFNDRFENYQRATQWVVQLAFTLIASATITVIITSVLRK